MRISTVFNTLSLIVTLLCIAGCTHNDGDIGPLFGRWKLAKMTADGVPLTITDAADGPLSYYWAFQGKIMWIMATYPHNDYINHKALWSRNGDKLVIDFTNSNNGYIGEFDPPAELHLVENGITPLTITTLTSDRLQAWYVADNDVRYEYYLEKYY